MDKLKLARILLRNEGIILDIRSPKEFSKGHICGATNIPTPLPPLSSYQKHKLGEQLSTFLYRSRATKDTPIIVYCKKGIRAEMAKERLKKYGMSIVLNLGGVLEEPLKSIMNGNILDPYLKPCYGSL